MSSDGRYENRNSSSSTTMNAPISFAVTSGDAYVSAGDSNTNGGGTAAFSVEGGSTNSTITITATFAGMSGSTTITVGASDADGDGYSDAAEAQAGTNKNDAASHPPPQTMTESDHGDWIESSVKIEELLLSHYTVEYRAEGKTHTSGSVSAQLGKESWAAIAAELGIEEGWIDAVNPEYTWQIVLDRTLPLIGVKAASFTPWTIPGYAFDIWIHQPVDIEQEHETNVTYDYSTGSRMTTTYVRGSWSAEWQLKRN